METVNERRLVLIRASADGTECDVPPSDDDLMLLARGGAREAFDQLVVRHQTRMLRVAFRLLRESACAADAVQNTFVELFCNLTRYRACGKFKSYLYRLLLNQCRRVMRRGRTEQRALATVSAMQHLTHDQILEHEHQHDLNRRLAVISPKQRAVLLLRFTADLGYQEIADTLDIPVGTVKSRVSEAVARMRETMEDA